MKGKCNRCNKEGELEWLVFESSLKKTKLHLCHQCFTFCRELFIMFMGADLRRKEHNGGTESN